MNKKRMNKIIKSFFISFMAIALALSGRPPTMVDAAQPGTPSGVGTLRPGSDWAISYDIIGYSLMYSGYTTSVSSGDSAVKRHTSSRYYSHDFRIDNDGGTLRYLRGSRYVPRAGGGWVWTNQEVAVTPANFNRNNLVRGRSLLDNMYLESGVNRNTLDSRLVNGGTAWLNAIMGVRTNSHRVYPTMYTGRLWGQGRNNFNAPARVFTTSAGVLASTWSWHPDSIPAIKSHFDISVSMPKIDDTPPAITISPNSDGTWRNTNRTVTATATDAGSGVKRMRWRIERNGSWGGWSSWQSTSSLNVNLSNTGKQRVQIQAQDNFNNTGNKTSGYFHIDKTAPGGSITPSPTSWTNGNVTLTFNATDSGGSGVRRVRQSGGSWVNGSRTTRTVTGKGTYSFEVQDNAGNTKTVSRAVTNIDKTTPTLNSPTILNARYTNGNDYWVRPGDNVVIRTSGFDDESRMRNSNLRLLGNGNDNRAEYQWYARPTSVREYQTTGGYTSIYGGSENYWGWTAIYDFNVRANTNAGNRLFDVYTYHRDNADNNTGWVDSGLNLRTDATAPTISANPASRGWGNSNVSVTLTHADGQSGIATRQYAWSTSTSTPSSWTNYSSAVTQSTQGTWYLHARAVDNVGHVTTQRFGPYRIDKTLPNATFSPNSASWQNTNRAVTVTATDTGGSGFKQLRTRVETNGTWGAWSAWQTGSTKSLTASANGKTRFQVEVQDNAGNTRTVTSGTYHIDKTLPNATFSPNSASWQNSNRAVTVTATDSGGSGFKQLRTRVETNGTWGGWSGWQTGSTKNLTASTNGKTRFQVEVHDNVGNTRTVTSGTYHIDKVVPTVNAPVIHDARYVSGNNYWYRPGDNLRVDISGTDDHSGITYSYLRLFTSGSDNRAIYRWGDSSFSEFSTATYSTISRGSALENSTRKRYRFNASVKSNSDNQDLQVHSYFTDVAGNTIGYIDSGLRVRVDGTAPTVSASSSSSAWGNTNANVTLTYSDSRSGVQTKQYAWSTSTATPSSWNNYTSQVSQANNGTWYLHYRTVDNVGNVRTGRFGPYRVDKTIPNGTISGNPTNWTRNNVTLTFSGTDSGGSGVRRVRLPNGTWVNGSSASQTVSQNGTYTFRVEDNAGNIRDVSATVNRIDKTAPTNGITQTPTAWTNQPVRLLVQGSDTQSGIQKIEQINQSTDAGRNVLTKSQELSTFSRYNGATATTQDNVSVPEWGVTDATRIRTVRGSGDFQTYYTFNPSNSINWIDAAGQTYTYSVNIRNDGNANIIVAQNGIRGASHTIRPGESKRISSTGTVRDNPAYNFVQVHFRSSGNMNMVLWGQKAEKGSTATPYTPAPEEVKAKENLLTDGNVSKSTSEYMVGQYNLNEPLEAGKTYTMTIKGTKKSSQNFGLWQNGASTGRGNLTHLGNNIYELTFTAASPISGRSAIENSRVRIYQPSSGTRGPATIEWARLVKHDSNPKAGMHHAVADYEVAQNGTYTFRITDNVGNYRDQSITVSNIDTIKPNGTITGNPTSWQNTNATLTFNATDSGGSGVRRVRKPNGTWVNGSTTSQTVTANGTYTFRVEDHAGNIRDVSVTVNRIDKTLPNASSTQSPTVWTNGNVNITWTANATGSPLRRVRTHNGSTWSAWSAVSGTTSSTVQTVTSNGTYRFQVEDQAGNVREISRTVSNIDKVLPNGTITGNPTSWQNTNATLTFNATDTGGSGVRRVRQSGGTWVNGSTISRTVTANGTYSFEVEDHAGNKRTVSVTVTYIDKILPNASKTQSPTAWTNGNVNITWNASATGSPLRRIRTHNGSTWGAWSAVSGTSHTHTQSVSSNGTYHYQVQDQAGNVRQISHTVSNIDKVLPNMTVTSLNTDWTNTSINIRTTVNDRGDTGENQHISGVQRIRMRQQGGTWGAWRTFSSTSERSSANLTETWTIDENGTYEWQLQDRAGNIRTASQQVTNIDRLPPETSGSFTPDGWTNQTITITWLAKRTGDPGAPLDAYRYDRGNGNWTSWQNATHADAFTVTQDVTKNGTYQFEARDKAGNVARSSVTVTKHDIVLPVGQITARFDRSERDDHVDYTSNDLVDMVDSNRVTVDVTGVEDLGISGVDFVTIEEQRRIGYGSNWMTVGTTDYDWPHPYNTTSQTYDIDVSHAQDTRFILTVTDRAGNESSRVASNVVRQSVLQFIDFRITDVVNPQLTEDELDAIRASDFEGVVELTAGTDVTFDVTYQLRHLDTVDELSGEITIETISDDRKDTHTMEVKEDKTGHNRHVTFTKTFTVPQGTPKGSEITIAGDLEAKLANGTTHKITYPSENNLGTVNSHIEEFFRFRIVR